MHYFIIEQPDIYNIIYLKLVLSYILSTWNDFTFAFVKQFSVQCCMYPGCDTAASKEVWLTPAVVMPLLSLIMNMFEQQKKYIKLIAYNTQIQILKVMQL